MEREKILRQINELKRENNWQEILCRFDHLVQPGTEMWKDAELVKELGFAHSQMGNTEKALKLYRRWQELEPEKAQPHYAMGYVYYLRKEFQKAVECYDKALECYPGYMVCHYRKGVVLLAMGKSQLAHREFKWVIDEYEALRDEDKLRRMKKTYIRALYGDGKACYRMRKYKDAEERFRKVLRYDKKNWFKPIFKYYSLGKVCIELGKAEEAENLLQRARELKPQKDYIWDRLGRMYHRLKGDMLRAEECYRKALECRRVPYVLVNRALLYLDGGKEREALMDLQEALRKDKKGKHKILLILARVAIRAGRLEEAIGYLERAIEFKEKVYGVDCGEAHYLLSQIWRLKGDEEKAKKELTRAQEVDSDFVWSTRIMAEDGNVQFVDLDYEPDEEMLP